MSKTTDGGGLSSLAGGINRTGVNLMGGYMYESLQSYLKRHLDGVRQVRFRHDKSSANTLYRSFL
jgi:hypothetical protein